LKGDDDDEEEKFDAMGNKIVSTKKAKKLTSVCKTASQFTIPY
jgi:elongation factor 3